MNASDDRSASHSKSRLHSARRAQRAGLTVLIVDDSQTVRRTASEYLKRAGYAVITAVDGFDSLSKVVEYQPALIFVDIMMPRLDGYQTCALIKNNAQYRDTPVVMLSSKDGLFDKARGSIVGCDAHLSKPFTEELLTAVVSKHTGDSRQTKAKEITPAKPLETSGA